MVVSGILYNDILSGPISRACYLRMSSVVIINKFASPHGFERHGRRSSLRCRIGFLVSGASAVTAFRFVRQNKRLSHKIKGDV